MKEDLLFPDEETPQDKKKAPKPHYGGHRQRLRERFIRGGAESLQDYELLELILFMAMPRKDVKPLAKQLLERYGGLAQLLAAPVGQLAQNDGLSENSAVCLKAVAATAQRMMQRDLIGKPVLNSWDRLIDYCTAAMAHEAREYFRVLFLNKKNELIADEVQGVGTVDHTPAYPREIMKRALEVGATAIILVHNHPSGDPKPSQADIDMTRAVVRAGEPFGIILHDHIIVSRKGYKSFKSEGLI